MLKEWKNKRQLSLLVAFALSAGGGQLFFNHAHAADVTGGDVTYDTTLPADPIAGGAISPSTTDNGNVHGNTLTINGLSIVIRTLYGGYTTGTGNANNNNVILKNVIADNSNGTVVYGGWSRQGNATGNTITLAGSSTSLNHRYLSVFGGNGNGGVGKDYTTGNTLQIKGINNGVYQVANFENLKYVLGSNIPSGSTMLTNHWSM